MKEFLMECGAVAVAIIIAVLVLKTLKVAPFSSWESDAVTT
jgi:hypothetical protein